MLSNLNFGTFVFFGVSLPVRRLSSLLTLCSDLLLPGWLVCLAIRKYSPRTLGVTLNLIIIQVPETKGLTLEEMDDVFGDEGGTSVADQERILDIHKRIGLAAYAHSENEKERASDEKVDIQHV